MSDLSTTHANELRRRVRRLAFPRRDTRVAEEQQALALDLCDEIERLRGLITKEEP